MFGLLSIDKRGNQRAINLLGNGWVRPQFPRQFSHLADDLFDPLRRFHLVSGFLEMRGLLDIAAPFNQQRDNLAINAVDVGADFFEELQLSMAFKIRLPSQSTTSRESRARAFVKAGLS